MTVLPEEKRGNSTLIIYIISIIIQKKNKYTSFNIQSNSMLVVCYQAENCFYCCHALFVTRPAIYEQKKKQNRNC